MDTDGGSYPRDVVDALDVGVVAPGPGPGQVTVNPAASVLLHLNPGVHPASTVESAIDALAKRAKHGDDTTAAARPVSQHLWRFDAAPTRLRVVSTPDRGWLFYDESPMAAAEDGRAVLRAWIEAQLDPMMLIGAVRDDTGQIVEFTYRDLNGAARTQIGVARERLIGRGLGETLPEFTESGLLRRYIECVDNGAPVVLDDYGYTSLVLGQALRCEIHTTRVDHDLLAVSWRDVTDRFDHVQRITESEAQFRLLAENIGEVVMRIDDDGTIRWMSASVENAVGAPAEHFIGRKSYEFGATDKGAVFRREAARAGRPFVGRTRVVVNDTVHWIGFFLKPFFGADGLRDGLVVTFRVIDDEVAIESQVEEARRRQTEADARWQRMMANAAVGMCISDLSGRFHEVNRSMCDFFGHDEAALKQLTWQELTAPEFLGQDLASVEYLLSGRIESYRTAKQFLHADGHRIWGDQSVTCLRSPDGGVEGFIAQITDITKEVEARRSLSIRDEQNRELAERLQAQTDRLTADLGSAALYVASILPADLDGTVEVSSRYVPSQALAGDVFDFRWIDDDHLIAYLLDVSGHGIQAALLSVSVHNLLRSGSLSGSVLMKPDHVLAELNEMFAMEKHAGNYFTMWCGVYQASTRTLRYCSGGHPPALLLPGTPDTAAPTPLSTDGMPVGMFSDSEYACATVHVEPGSHLLLYSDGAYEMAVPEGETWSFRDFTATCSQIAQRTGWTLDTLIDDLRRRTADGSFEDDLSLVRLAFAR